MKVALVQVQTEDRLWWDMYIPNEHRPAGKTFEEIREFLVASLAEKRTFVPALVTEVPEGIRVSFAATEENTSKILQVFDWFKNPQRYMM